MTQIRLDQAMPELGQAQVLAVQRQKALVQVMLLAELALELAARVNSDIHRESGVLQV